ncbi:MAG: FHA domain-containing protein [Varibaculum sp.]|nr:FHA domain-containing protein [Varibaculum sp.]
MNSESEEPRQVSLSSDALEAIKRLPKGSALLVVHTGNPGARFLLDVERVTVGRKPSSDIFFDDVTVSRKHAEFFRTDDGYGVRDSGSLNGTYVNRERVEKVELQSGDEVQIGKYRMSYHAGSAN